MQREDLLQREDAAKYLKVSVSFLAQRARTAGPLITRIGRKVFYLREDLDDFIEQQRSVSQCQLESLVRKSQFTGAKIVPTTGAGGSLRQRKEGHKAQGFSTVEAKEAYWRLKARLGHFGKPGSEQYLQAAQTWGVIA